MVKYIIRNKQCIYATFTDAVKAWSWYVLNAYSTFTTGDLVGIYMVGEVDAR